MSRQDRTDDSSPHQRNRFQRWRRFAVRALGIVAATVVLLAAASILALRVPATRQALLHRATTTIERASGVHLTARDFSLSIWRGELTIDDVVLRAEPDASPFLRVAHIQAVVSRGSLLGDRMVIRSLRLEGAHADLGAPLPESSSADNEEEAATPTIDIKQIVLTGGAIDSGPLPANLEMWFDAVSASGIEVAGSYLDDDLRLELSQTPVVFESARRPTIEATLEATLGYALDGALALEALKLEGDGLLLTASGSAKLDSGQATTASTLADLSFMIQAMPALLLPDLATGGRLDGTGKVTVRGDRLTNKMRLDVQELPAEILRPWITSPDLDLDGTVLDVDADLTGQITLAAASNDDPLDRLTGHAEVTWRRGDEPRLAASLRSLDEAAPGIGLAFEATALPGEPGTRRLTGELRAQRWLSLVEGELHATRIDLEVPDLEAAVARLGLPPDLDGFRPAGEIRATADVSGPLLKPGLRLDATWLLDGEALAEIEARTLTGAALAGPLLEAPLHLALDARLLPGSAGRRRLAGEFLADDLGEVARGELARAQLEDVRLDLELPDLTTTTRDLERHWRRLFPDRELPSPLIEGAPSADGALTLTARGAGPVLAPSLEAEADWRPAADEHVHIQIAGSVATEAPFFSGQARLRLAELDLAHFAETDPTLAGEANALTGRVTATLDFEGDLDAHRATVDAEILDLRSGDGVGLVGMRLTASSNGARVDISSLTGSLTTGQTFSGVGHLDLELMPHEQEADGPVSVAPRLAGGELRLELPRPIETLERLVAALELDDDTIAAEIALDGQDSPESRPIVLARVPLTALAGGTGDAWLSVSGLELEPFLPLLGLAEDAVRPRARFDGSLTIDLSDLTASTGTIDISNLAVEGPEGNVEAVKALQLELVDRRLELKPGELLGSGGGVLQASGALELAPGWQPGDDPAALVTDLTLDLNGRFELAVLNPLLVGGRASGELGVALEVRGPPAAARAEGRFDGSDVELFYAAPYVTRVESPIVELTSDGEGARFTTHARLNGGDLQASGTLTRESGLSLQTGFQGVRYRLDYGLTTRLSGDLELRRLADDPRSRLAGDVVLERGTLRNDVALDRETLSQLLAPDLTSTEDASAYDLIDLDLSVTTADGVSVKNNLGELRADWSRLRVRGTLRTPLLSGRIDVDSGGKLTAYGQTLRIDEASIAFSGDSAAPRIVFETTSSLEDPSITDDRRRFSQSGLGDSGPGSGGYWDRRQADVEVGNELTKGVLNHLTDRAAGSLSQGLSRTELSLEPLQIFGETDTTARLTASQQISAEANLIYSVNPRDAEGQTYILELHDADLAPSLTAQLFTNDDDNEGVTLQQTLQLGAGRRGGEQGRRLGGIRIQAPEEIEQRHLKQALGVRKRDPFPDDAEFDVEVDAIAELQRQGYPAAEVKVTVESGKPELPVLDLRVEPGPRVRFIFDGTRPPGPARRSIAQAYNLNAEEVALEDMRRATVKALRGQGYIAPSVEVTTGVEDDEPEPDRNRETKIVRVVADGGRRIAPGPPELEGVPPEVAGLVASQFESLLARVELAAAEPGADRYLLQSLAAVGYPEARILIRELSEDGETLKVRVESGICQRLARVEILGLQEADAARMLQDLPVQSGDPLRSDLITRAAHSIEDKLRQRGHAQASVRTLLEPMTAALSASPPAGAGDLILRYEVDAGAIHHIAGVRLEGLRGNDRAWASRVAGLEAGSVFRDEDVGAARRRLTATGLFKGVRATTGPAPEESRADSTEPGTARSHNTAATLVTFNLEERPRYLLSYGGRWESGEDIGVVVDAVDRSFLGRGTTLGMRAIYSGQDDRSLRLYHAIPRILGSKSSFEVFLEGKNEDIDGQLVSGIEAWTQLTFPLSPRSRNRLYLRYQDLFIRTAPGDGLSSDTTSDEGRVVVPSVGWQFSVDTRDRALGARRPDGLFASFDVVGSHADLGSDISVLGIFSQFKVFTSLAEQRTKYGASRYVTWAQSFRIGLLEPFESTDIPSVERLRAGGEYSVRGYRRESLGPLDAENSALGGELFFIVNQELRFPVLGDWLGGLVFFDAGNVWTSRDALDSELFTAAGVGLRAATPAGPLRLDIAVPLDRRLEIDDSVKVYLGFGHVF